MLLRKENKVISVRNKKPVNEALAKNCNALISPNIFSIDVVIQLPCG